MTSEVSVELKAQFMADKCLYDSLSQAIKLAKTSGCSEKQIRPLTLMKQEYKKLCSNNTSKMLRAMPLSTNVVQVEGNWHAIRYVNEKADICLKIDIIGKDEAHLLVRDGRYERELTRTDLENLLPALIDEESLELYKQHLASKARELVYEQSGVLVDGYEEPEETEEPIPDEEKPTTISSHAGLRWVQRVIGIKGDQQAEEYRRKHLAEVNEAVLDGYGKAEQVWADEDDITYWFDADNIMYVRGMQNGNPNIITLYEEEFGFTKEINRLITIEQLRVLTGVRDALKGAEQQVSETNTKVDDEVRGINDEINVLESQIALLVSQRAKAMADRDLSNKQAKAHKDKYVAEFNKLFKKWDV